MFPELFVTWIESQRESLEARGFHVESVVPNLDRDDSGWLYAARVDFELPKFLGDIMVWRAGHCDIGVVDIETGESKHECLVFTSTGEHPFPGDWRRLFLIQKPEDFAPIFEEFLAPFLEPSLTGEPS